MPLNWHENVVAEDVELYVDKSVLSDIEEWLGIENVNFISGKYLATVKLPFDKGLVSKIMSYGNGIKVIAPTELVNEIKEKLDHPLRDVVVCTQ